MPNESKRSIHGWFLGFASILLVIALGVLFNAAGDLTEAAVNFKNLTVKQPRFADFVGPQRYEMLMKKISKRPPNNLNEKIPVAEPVKSPTPVGDQRLELDPAVQKAFEFFADYENKLYSLIKQNYNQLRRCHSITPTPNKTCLPMCRLIQCIICLV